MGTFWQVLYDAGAELILVGHDHGYERFLAMSPSGAHDPAHGIVQLVVGTGGVGGATYANPRSTSAVREGNTWGVMRLTLRPDGWDFQFVPVAGRTFTDSGSGTCHGAP
jgi:hypothetical protein